MTVAPIVKRELKAYFTSSVIYVVVAVFLTIAGYFFYTNLVMCSLFAGSGVSLDLWEYLFNDLSYILLLLMPLISMRLFAEEKKLGTIELLFTSPIRDSDILLGKYLAGLGIIILMLLLSALYPLLAALIHIVPLPVIFTGYAGLLLLGACFLACGILLSSLTENQVVAAIATVGLLLFFWFIDRNEDAAGAAAAQLLRSISLFRHFYHFTLGVIDSRDVVYFISVSGACLALTVASLRSQMWKGTALKRTGFTAFGSAGVSLLVATALLGLNVPATVYNRRFDLTLDKRYTLSAEAVQVLQSVRAPLAVTLFGKKEQRRMMEDLLERMQLICPQLSAAWIDVDKNPAKASLLQGSVERAGTVEYQGRRENITTLSDEELLGKIYFLTRGREKLACFITGHAERDVADTSNSGFSAARSVLKAENFTVIRRQFSGAPLFPASASIVIAAGPKQDFTDTELAALGDYFTRGGRVLLLLDPAPLPRLSRFLSGFNIETGQDIIVDGNSRLPGMDELSPLMAINQEHPIARGVSAAVQFIEACSVQVGTHFVPGFSWEILAQSGRGSWGERDAASARRRTAQYQDGIDLRGPVQTGVIVKTTSDSRDKTRGGRMAVLGNARFAANENITTLGNKDFFLSTVVWLAEQDTFNSMPALRKEALPAAPPLILTERDSYLIMAACFAEPLVIVCAGVWVTIRRRFRR